MNFLMKIFFNFFILFSTTLFSQSIIENFTGGNTIADDITIAKDNVILAISKNSFESRPVKLYEYNKNKFELMNILTNDKGNIIISSNSPKIQTNINGDLSISDGYSVYLQNGDKWLEYKRFEQNPKNIIQSFLIDNKNNYWAIISKSEGINFLLSYLTTFDKNSNIIVDSSNYPKYQNELFKSYDNMVVTYCAVFGTDTNASKDDIYFFKDGKIVNTLKLPSANGKFEYKNMNQIYTDKDNNIWFCYTGKHYTDPKYENTLSGLSVLKKNGDWVHFTNQDKYPKYNDSYSSAKGIAKFGDGWLVLLENDLLYINDKFEITDFDIVNFWNNTVFYKTTEMTNDITIQYLNRMKNREEGYKPDLMKIISDKEGRIFITSNIGIFVYNNGITSVDEARKNKELLYPNPIKSTDEYLNIKSLTNQIVKAEIIDITGNTFNIKHWEKSEELTRVKLPFGLSSGTYYLQLTTTIDQIRIKFNVVK